MQKILKLILILSFVQSCKYRSSQLTDVGDDPFLQTYEEVVDRLTKGILFMDLGTNRSPFLRPRNYNKTTSIVTPLMEQRFEELAQYRKMHREGIPSAEARTNGITDRVMGIIKSLGISFNKSFNPLDVSKFIENLNKTLTRVNQPPILGGLYTNSNTRQLGIVIYFPAGIIVDNIDIWMQVVPEFRSNLFIIVEKTPKGNVVDYDIRSWAGGGTAL